MNTAEAIKARRTSISMTEEEVARKAGLRVARFRVIEAGEMDPRLSTYVRIAHAMGQTVEELMHGVSNTERTPAQARHEARIAENRARRRAAKAGAQ